MRQCRRAVSCASAVPVLLRSLKFAGYPLVRAVPASQPWTEAAAVGRASVSPLQRHGTSPVRAQETRGEGGKTPFRLSLRLFAVE